MWRPQTQPSAACCCGTSTRQEATPRVSGQRRGLAVEARQGGDVLLGFRPPSAKRLGPRSSHPGTHCVVFCVQAASASTRSSPPTWCPASQRRCWGGGPRCRQAPPARPLPAKHCMLALTRGPAPGLLCRFLAPTTPLGTAPACGTTSTSWIW